MSSTDAGMLRLQGLNAFYGQSHILHDIDLNLAEGQSLALLGRNGMGKTTLIRSCLGLLPGVRGSIAVRGRQVRGWAPETIARLGIGYVPEGRGIFTSLSVRENLLMAARGNDQAGSPWNLDTVLKLFPRLQERFGHGGGQLSGGEQQMLSIGRALMTNPALLVIDEVTEGLAPLVMIEIWNTLRKVREAGVACILVDRNYRSVLENTDHCVFLEKGRAVWSGASSEALADRALLERYLGV